MNRTTQPYNKFISNDSSSYYISRVLLKLSFFCYTNDIQVDIIKMKRLYLFVNLGMLELSYPFQTFRDYSLVPFRKRSNSIINARTLVLCQILLWNQINMSQTLNIGGFRQFISAILKLEQKEIFCNNSIILMTLIILKENLETLL